MIAQSMPMTFDAASVAFALLISAIGAFLGLTASSVILQRGQRVSRINLVAAGSSLGGIGIWAMHFIGMLGTSVGMGVSYSMPETFASLAIAVGGCTLALAWVARNPGQLRNLLGGGTLLGAAVVAMHYLGMGGMRFGGYVEWSMPMVAASVAIAAAASLVALWLAFRVRGVPARVAAAAVMAGAVGAMHYTGMAAADFICTTATPSAFVTGAGLVPSLQLPVLVTVMSLGLAAVIGVDQAFQRMERVSRVAAR